MLRKYSIHHKDEGIDVAVAYLYYDEETRLYSLDITGIRGKDPMPAMIIVATELNKLHFDDKLARAYVREHVIPPDRAGIDYILKKLDFPYYDAIFFLDKFRGRSVMDDYLIDRVDGGNGYEDVC